LGDKRAGQTHFPATREFEVADFMPGNSLYRRPQAFGLCNSSLGQAVRQRRVDLTNSAAYASSLSTTAAINGLILRRIVDITFSAIAVLFLWPLLLVIALAIKLESPGPVIYLSLRAGKNGQPFLCYKFRTMFDGADELRDSLRPFNERQDPFFKIADDPRVTRFGRFLRKYSLDELPQFWNVLKGDMSLVGPRPHPADDYARYRPEDHRRLDVKPGITGLWQVTERTNPSFETRMTLDLEYMRNWSLSLDLKILMRTVPTVLSGDGQ
jgi:exopolysaccharide biosynthesis polyprenyl glycosylphosphotransferase